MKQKHYSKLSRKLAYYKINPKFYWFILKRFLNNKKIPCIPPSIHNNQFVIDFKGKSKLFNSFFAKQCTNIETRSNLPTQILRRTNKCLNTINFTKDDILRVISKLNPDKGHGHDQISISIIQICDKAIYKPLNFIYSSWIKSGIFPNKWKTAIVLPIQKRDNKQNVKNYRPVLLLPVFLKIFERLIYNEVYSFFIECNLIFLCLLFAGKSLIANLIGDRPGLLVIIPDLIGDGLQWTYSFKEIKMNTQNIMTSS